MSSGGHRRKQARVLTAPLVRSPYLRECGRYRAWRAERRGRIRRQMRPNKSGANRTSPVTGAPSRRAIPLTLGGTEKERELRANPRARIKTGAEFLLLFDN